MRSIAGSIVALAGAVMLLARGLGDIEWGGFCMIALGVGVFIWGLIHPEPR